MLKKTLGFIFFILLTPLHAETSIDGQGYVVLSPPQPTQHADKIEVIEFFWYGCPHCYHLEPALAEWLKTKPDNVEFIRQPAIFSSLWEKHAKAYFIAQALGIVDKVHADFFDTIQNKKQKLTSQKQLGDFFAKHGVSQADFQQAFDSFLVDAKLRQAKAMAPRYGITGVPTIVINGKYKTSASLAKSQENMIRVMNLLIKQDAQTLTP